MRGLSDVGVIIDKAGMAVGALIACVLDNTIPGTDEERGLVAWAQKEAA